MCKIQLVFMLCWTKIEYGRLSLSLNSSSTPSRTRAIHFSLSLAGNVQKDGFSKHANFRGKLQMILRTTLIAFAGAAQWHGGACCEMQIFCRLVEWELLEIHRLKCLRSAIFHFMFVAMCAELYQPLPLSHSAQSSSSTAHFNSIKLLWYDTLDFVMQIPFKPHRCDMIHTNRMQFNYR